MVNCVGRSTILRGLDLVAVRVTLKLYAKMGGFYNACHWRSEPGVAELRRPGFKAPDCS